MGWSIIPLSYNERTPIAPWKEFQTARVQEDAVDSWEDMGAPTTQGFYTPFNIGLVTGAISGLVVVDCDNEEAVNFAKKNGLVSPVSVNTSRGKHFYFRHPGGGKTFRNAVGTNPGRDWYNCPGLDFRGDGGYVVCPPSLNVKSGVTYTFNIPEGMDFDDIPLWEGKPSNVDVSQEFSLQDLDLSSNTISSQHTSLDVYDQVKNLTNYLGRKLQGPDQGDGTDIWMIKFCGQQVRRGLTGEDLSKSVVQFFRDFFNYNASESVATAWLRTKVRSALDMDRRNYPQDYEADGTRKGSENKTIIEESGAVKSPTILRPIVSADIDGYLANLGTQEFYADPIIPSQSIVQVVGYNGHGKSFFLTSLLISMCAGQKSFGPYEFTGKVPKVFYMDFDNPARTVLGRAKSFINQFGDTGKNFNLWSPAIIPPDCGGDINLMTDDGAQTMNNWLKQEKPDIIVIDTLRNAFGGFEENSPQDWHKVNHMARLLRDYYKATIILVHHRNKPGPSGLGRESGSTAQMTNIDTQIMVTQVYNDEHLAKRKAGLFADDCFTTVPGTPGGGSMSKPIGKYLKDMAGIAIHTDIRFRMISEISFGKVRQTTELHDTHYIGYGEDLTNGKPFIQATKSKKQIAQNLYSNHWTLVDISRELMVPKQEIEKWVL